MRYFYFNSKKQSRGQAILISVILFLAISSTIVLGIATPILKQVKNSTELVHSKETYYLAEASLEDALYRLRSNKTVATGDTVVLNGATSTITLTTTSSGKTIDATANVGGRIRKMEAQIIQGVGASFNYGIQSGTGGFDISGGSTINGNAYANGSILGSSATITGSAIAANSASLSSDQTNNTPTTPTTNLVFGNASASQDVAQSFSVSTSSPLNYIQFYVKKVSTPANATVRIVTDSSGSPSTNVIDTATLGDASGAAAVGTSYGWVTATFSGNVTLDPAVTYWMVIDAGTSATKYYTIGTNTGVYSGVSKIGQYGSTWSATSPANSDLYFQLYLGGITSTIGGGSYVGSMVIGSAGVGDAWAHTVQGASVAGSLYCATGTTNNKACNTSRPDPALQGYPISDSNIQQWKTDAVPGNSGWTYSGNLTIGSSGTTTTTLRTINGNLTINGGGTADMGELVVNGNVTITSGGTLKAGPMKVNGTLSLGSTGMTVKGTLWITGNITVSSGSTLRLDSSYGASSSTIVSDGILSLTGGGNFYGSGTTGSFPMVVTTSDCPVGPTCSGSNAIEFSGGAGAVVLYAPYGTLHMSGGTNAKSLVANKIIIDSGGTITYDSGLANLNFSSGPSGGWNVSKWIEVQ